LDTRLVNIKKRELQYHNMLKQIISLSFLLLIVIPIQPALLVKGLVDPNAETNNIPKVYGMDFSAEVYDKVSLSRYKNFIIKLTENGSRWTSAGPTFSDANIFAHNWIARSLGALSGGKIEVETIGNHRSIVGKLPGWIGGDAPVIVIGGHYDSVLNAPGANDDGTGIATVLELAYVLSRYNWPLDIYFCAFNSEEIGLVGSNEVAAYLSHDSVQILQFFNVDMLLVENENAPADERVLMAYNNDPETTYETSHYWADLTRMMSRNLGRDLIMPIASNSFSAWTRSDHYSFLNWGYQGVLFAFESGSGSDSAYHSPMDTWDNPMYNYTVAHETVASIGASIAYTMSRSFGAPMMLNYSGMIERGELGYYIANTINTKLNITLTWDGGPISIDIFNPSQTLVEHLEISNSSGVDKRVMSVDLVQDGLHEIALSSDGEREYQIILEYESDIDGDNIRDSEQYWFDVELFEIDHDADGLSDAEEMILGTNIWSRDTDGDLMEDLWEIENGFNPLNATDGLDDEDNDGISNTNEVGNGTSIFSMDTDSDLMPDLYEIVNHLNPVVDDRNEDADNDLVTNYDEFLLGLNPQSNDTDNDAQPDGWEVEYGLKPLVNDSHRDPDHDSLANIVEYQLGTSPKSADTDSDSMPDNYEVDNGLNPLIDDALGDLDSDDLTNIEEFELGTNPQSNDSDQDLMPDAWEVSYDLNPLRNDSQRDPDQDGVINLDEYLNGLNPRVSDKQVALQVSLMFMLGILLIAIPAVVIWKKY
jgi:hypothetical protein